MTQTELPTLAVASGQTVQVHAHGRILASAIRNGRGWSVLVDGEQYEASNLDRVLELLSLLPHHRRRR
jgi:hypothetical protein